MGNKMFEDLKRARQEPPKVNSHGQEPLEVVPLEEEGESWEDPAGDGRVSRHPVLGVQFLDGRKLLAWVPYGAVTWGESGDVTRRLVLEAIRGDTLTRITLEGESPGFGMMADKLMEGKRVSVRINAASVTAISIEAVPVKGKGG